MVSKLIVLPLITLLFISIFGFYLNGTVGSAFGQGMMSAGNTYTWDDYGYYTYTAKVGDMYTGLHHVMWYNGSCVDDAGHIEQEFHWFAHCPEFWVNATGRYDVINTYEDLDWEQNNFVNYPWTLTALGMIGLVAGCVALGTLLGVKILGNGLNDISVATMVKGTAYISLFAVVSLYSFPMIGTIPQVGILLCLGISFIYALGVIPNLVSTHGDS